MDPKPEPPWVGRVLQYLPLGLMVMLIGFIARKSNAPVSDVDSWWHLRLGDDLWSQKSFAAPSDWSPRATVDWVPSEPLPEVIVSRIYHWVGLPGVAWVHAAAVLAVVLAVYVACRRVASPLPAVVSVTMASMVMSGSLTERPQLVSFVLLAVVQATWTSVHESLRPPWWLIPLTWFWSMCHGFWVIGVVLSGVCWVGIVLDRRPELLQALRLLAVPVASFAVVALSPAGPEVLLAPLSVNDTAEHISEWQRTQFDHPWGFSGLVVLVLLVALAIRQRRSMNGMRWLLILVVAFFLWYAERFVALSGVVAAPLVAERLQQALADGGRHLARRVEVGVLAVTVVISLGVLCFTLPHSADEPGGVPLGLDAELDRIPPGTGILNDYGMGGWLAWRHPHLDRTSDGLVVPYDPAYIGDLIAAQSGDGDWRRVVADAHVDYALLTGTSGLTKKLRADGWTVVDYADKYYLLARPGVRLPPAAPAS